MTDDHPRSRRRGASAAAALAAATAAFLPATTAGAHSPCRSGVGNAGVNEGAVCFNLLHHSSAHTGSGYSGSRNGIWNVRAIRSFSIPTLVCNYRARVDRHLDGGPSLTTFLSDTFHGCRTTSTLPVERPFPTYGDGSGSDEHFHYPAGSQFLLYWFDQWTDGYEKVTAHEI